jgi:hypothetical protein
MQVTDFQIRGELIREKACVKSIPLLGALLGLFLGPATNAAETITYTYDAKGRLTKVVRTGTVNNNVQTDYSHDKANNRTTVVRIKPP